MDLGGRRDRCNHMAKGWLLFQKPFRSRKVDQLLDQVGILIHILIFRRNMIMLSIPAYLDIDG